MTHEEGTRNSILICHPVTLFARQIVTLLHDQGHDAVHHSSLELLKSDRSHPTLTLAPFDTPVWEWLRSFRPEYSPVAILANHDPRNYQRAFADGARGIITESDDEQHILNVIHGAIGQHPPVPVAVLHTMAISRIGKTPGLQLTAPEIEALRLLSHGATINDVAAHIGYSSRTTNNILTTLYKRMGAANRMQAVAQAVRLGLIE